MYVSKPLYLWFILSAIIVIYDASYVLLRPQSLRAGKYFKFYSPYELYIKHDTLYGPNQDRFVVIQSWLNLVQAFLLFVSVILSAFSSKTSKIKGALLAMVTSAFVFWKTVIYVWYDHPFLSQQTQNFSVESLYAFYLPTSFWLLCPLWAIFSISSKLGADFSKNTSGKQKKA